jgi:hypothetical protein
LPSSENVKSMNFFTFPGRANDVAKPSSKVVETRAG